MATEENRPKEGIRKNVLKVVKAAVKATIVFVIYAIVIQLLAPISSIIPSLQQMIQTFIIVYVVLMIISDLASGTFFQHVFNGARALFVMIYLVFFLNAGIFEYASGSLSLTVDLRLFLVIAMMLELLGLAKAVLQAINYANERAEQMLI
ncbi:MAG TPA: hypothetical protein VEC97_02510 [Candidatus Acidoferrales bacterium]|nr:hypothetical protein [Candidatus Acidoferrales bacterium]